MPQFFIPIENAIAIRRKKGVTLTLQNLSATDVYLNNDPGVLNSTPPGSVPSGLKLAANTGFIQMQNFPGLIWARSAVATSIVTDP